MSNMTFVINVNNKDHAFLILEKFNRMRQEEKMCDFIIKVGDVELKTHRDILAASSDYFLAMFSHDTLEKRNGIVQMKKVSVSAVCKCVDYIYTGELETSLDELDDVFFIISMMQLLGAQRELSSLLESSLKPELFCKIHYVAEKYGLQELLAKCNNYALSSLDLLVDSGCLDLFEYEYMLFLLSSKLLSDNGFDEDAKLAIAIDWIKADTNTRQDMLMPLCELLKVQSVSQSCFKYLVENEHVCSTSTEFMELMHKSTFNSISVKSVKPSYRKCPIGILYFDRDCQTGQLYDLSTSKDTCTKLNFNPLPSCHHYTPVAVCAEMQIYFLCGNKSVFTLDLASHEWQERPKMLFNHGPYIRTTFHSGNIYVCSQGDMDRYNIASEKWEDVTRDIEYPDDCELITYQNRVMTIGGRLREDTTDVNILDTNSMTCSKFPSLIIARSACAAAAVNGDIFVVGGSYDYTPLSDVEYYDATTNSWTILPQTCHPHSESKLYAMRNMLYIVGGYHGCDTAENYDISSRQWTDFVMFNREDDRCISVLLSMPQLRLLLSKSNLERYE